MLKEYLIGRAVLKTYNIIKFYIDNHRITDEIKSDLSIIKTANDRLKRKVPFYKENIEKLIELIKE